MSSVNQVGAPMTRVISYTEAPQAKPFAHNPFVLYIAPT
jgi:hypothetical protein